MVTLRDLLLALQRNYFVNREEALEIFRKLIQTPAPLRLYHIFVIFGPGGIGKTMLLGEFRRICGEHGIANSIASMDMCHSPLDVLAALRENWEPRQAGQHFQKFDVLLSKLQNLQKQLQREEESDRKVSAVLGKVLGEISATALGGAITGLSLGPVGALLGAVGGLLTKEVLESFTSALLKSGLISRDDADFLSNLIPNLVSAFALCADRLAGQKQAVVLMLDAYEYAEKSERLNEWITGYLLPGLTEKTMVVISGRNQLESSFWQDYSSMIYQRRLEPFDKPDLVEYLKVRKIAAYQIDALLSLTAGLPLGAALWADIETQEKLGLSAVEAEQRSTEVIKAVVERLLEHIDDVPRRVIRICAIPRLFDEEILGYLIPGDPLPVTFDQLCKFSSIFHLRPTGLSMHEEVRKWLIEDFKQVNPTLCADLNRRMARFYQQKALSENKYSRKWFDYNLERLYHLLAAGDREGHELLRTLVDDSADMYDAGLLESLRTVISDTLDAFGFWDELLAGMIVFVRRDFVGAKKLLYSLSQKSAVPQIIKAQVLFYLCATSWYLSEYQAALGVGKEALRLYRQLGDRRGEYEVCERLGWTNAHLGNFAEAISFQEEGLKITRELQVRLGEGWALNGLAGAHLQSGSIRYAEDLLQQALSIWTDLGHEGGQFYALFHLGEIHAESGRFSSSADYYETALRTWPGCDDDVLVLARLGQIRSLQGQFEQAIELLEKSKRYCQERKKPYFEARAERFMADAYVLKQEWEKADEHYRQSVELSQRIGARYVEARALAGLLRMRYLQGAPLAAIQASVAAVEAIARANQYHNAVAEMYLYKGLAEIREALLLPQREGEISDDRVQEVAQVFLQAMMEALQYNSYVLDKALHEMVTNLRALDVEIADKICKQIATLWRLGEFNSQPFVEVERKLRERDALPSNQTPIVEQLTGGAARA